MIMKDIQHSFTCRQLLTPSYLTVFKIYFEIYNIILLSLLSCLLLRLHRLNLIWLVDFMRMSVKKRWIASSEDVNKKTKVKDFLNAWVGGRAHAAQDLKVYPIYACAVCCQLETRIENRGNLNFCLQRSMRSSQKSLNVEEPDKWRQISCGRSFILFLCFCIN